MSGKQLQNAARWALRQRMYAAKELDRSLSMPRGLNSHYARQYEGEINAFEAVINYLNKKLPKTCRVKLPDYFDREAN